MSGCTAHGRFASVGRGASSRSLPSPQAKPVRARVKGCLSPGGSQCRAHPSADGILTIGLCRESSSHLCWAMARAGARLQSKSSTPWVVYTSQALRLGALELPSPSAPAGYLTKVCLPLKGGVKTPTQSPSPSPCACLLPSLSLLQLCVDC